MSINVSTLMIINFMQQRFQNQVKPSQSFLYEFLQLVYKKQKDKQKYFKICIIKIQLNFMMLAQINSQAVIFQQQQNNIKIIKFQVFEHIETTDLRELLDDLNTEDIKCYMKQLLNALVYCHSKGIMHRDIKPHNLLIDHQKRLIKIADWGLAQYYTPGQQYSVRVSTRHYKAPQLLLNNKKYNYSLDIWSLGLTFASMLFCTRNVFNGNSNPDQLNQYAKHFGFSDIQIYMKKYNLSPDQKTMQVIQQARNLKKNKYYKQRSWKYYIDKDNQGLCEPMALDLLTKMLRIDHEERITAKQALKHSYFQ